MLIISEYLRDKIYFDSFEEAKEYYGHNEAKDIDDLNGILESEAEGMASPILREA